MVTIKHKQRWRQSSTGRGGGNQVRRWRKSSIEVEATEQGQRMSVEIEMEGKCRGEVKQARVKVMNKLDSY